MQWLITGCSSGIGLSLARAVLAQPGQKLIATSRNPDSSAEVVVEITSNPNAVWETLDVASADLETRLADIIGEHGPIDVLINNAGYAIGGVFESIPLPKIRQQYETNFFGVVRTMQAIIPEVRKNKSGVIVNISSSEFWEPHPGLSVYASTKWAIEGVSQALAGELAAFGIRVLLVQPGSTRTALADPKKATESLIPLPESYQGTMVDYVLQAVASSHGQQTVDPDKSASAVVEEVLNGTEVKGKDGSAAAKVLRIQLGSDSVGVMQKQLEKFQAEGNIVRERAMQCDYEA